MDEEHSVPIIEVAYTHDKWWSLPSNISAELYTRKVNNQDARYTWDWGEGGRTGSWRPNGEQTRLNRYTIDFINNVQTNIDNGRRRSIRIIWVRPRDVKAQFTGKLPAPGPAEDVDVERAADVDEEGAADVDEDGEPTFGA